jgi:hypothetical protein
MYHTDLSLFFSYFLRVGAKDKVNPSMEGLNWFLFLCKRRGNRERYESMYCKLERFAFFF